MDWQPVQVQLCLSPREVGKVPAEPRDPAQESQRMDGWMDGWMEAKTEKYYNKKWNIKHVKKPGEEQIMAGHV